MREFLLLFLAICSCHSVWREIGSACCDDVLTVDVAVNECAGIKRFSTSELIFVNDKLDFPRIVKQQWVNDPSGEMHINCGETIISALNETCNSLCLTTEAGNYCTGNAEFCSLNSSSCPPTTSLCYCDVGTGRYVLTGAMIDSDELVETVAVNCSSSYVPLIKDDVIHGREILEFQLSSRNVEPISESEPIYTDLIDETLVSLRFISRDYRTIQTRTRSKTYFKECSSDSCTLPLERVCLGGEISNITVINMDKWIWTSVLFDCPDNEVIQHATQGSFSIYDFSVTDYSTYPTWNTATWYYKLLILGGVLASLYMIYASSRLLLWLLTPFLWMAHRPIWFGKWIMDRSKRARSDSSGASSSIYGSGSMINKAIVILMLLPLVLGYDRACGVTNVLSGQKVLTCTSAEQNSRNCSLSVLTQITIPTPGSVACLVFELEGQTAATLYIEYLQHRTFARLYTQYYTSDWDLVSNTVARCPQTDKCADSSSCSKVQAQDTNPGGALDPNSPVVLNPGISRCDSGCSGGAAPCGCFYIDSMCQFSKASVIQKTNTMRIVDRIGTLFQEPILKITMEDAIGNVLFSIAKVSNLGNVISLFGSKLKFTYNGNYATSSPTFDGTALVSDMLTMTSVLAPYAPKGAPSPSIIGDIQASQFFFGPVFTGSPNTSYIITSSGFTFSPQVVASVSAVDGKTVYTSSSPGVSRLGIYPKVPVVIDGNVWNTEWTTSAKPAPSMFYTYYANPGALVMSVEATNFINVTVLNNLVCPRMQVRDNKFGGCSSCLSGGYQNITASTSCLSGVATINLYTLRWELRSSNLLTRSILLTSQTQEYKIYFSVTDERFDGFICVNSTTSGQCGKFGANFPKDINVGNSTFVPANDTTTPRPPEVDIKDSSWFISFGDALNSAKDWIVEHAGTFSGALVAAIIVAVLAVIAVVFGPAIVSRVTSNSIISKMLKRTKTHNYQPLKPMKQSDSKATVLNTPPKGRHFVKRK